MFDVRTTGKEDLDRVQGDIKKAFDIANERIAIAQRTASAAKSTPPQSPSGVTPGTYAIAGITSITVDIFGRITKIT